MFASLNENGHQIMEEMEQGDVLTAVQSKLDDMNDRWQSLNLRTLDIRDRLEETATEWRQLLIDLQEALDWIARADGDLNSQQPLGGDLEAVQNQNEAHQVHFRHAYFLCIKLMIHEIVDIASMKKHL